MLPACGDKGPCVWEWRLAAAPGVRQNVKKPHPKLMMIFSVFTTQSNTPAD
jgi:hypothetical protein